MPVRFDPLPDRTGSNLYETDRAAQTRVILVGLNTSQKPEEYARSMRELEALAEALDLQVVWTMVQNAEAVTHATYIGSGKVQELKDEIDINDADLVVFNEALSPLQTRNLEKILDTEVMDRTGLILQIFSRRARTREARLQVESAQLKYMLPRLIGLGQKLSRQGGGSGRLSNKGAGEQQLELDRRHIEHRIAQLRRELESIDRERSTQRSRRVQSGLPRIALVGYTNAGKSTLLNALLRMGAESGQTLKGPGASGTGGSRAFGGSRSDGNSISGDLESKLVFEKDMLFATLDTSVRRLAIPGHLPFLLADTVGFVSQLPHDLVQAFRSTLEEVCDADLLLEVIDCSDPDHEMHRKVTDDTLREIGAGEVPRLYLYNKADLAMTVRRSMEGSASQDDLHPTSDPFPSSIPFIPEGHRDTIYLSAKQQIGLEELLTLIDDVLCGERVRCRFLFPYAKAGMMQSLRECAVIESEEYTEEGCVLQVLCPRKEAQKLKEYLF